MALATLTGVALAPGTSQNRRRYTPEVIGRAYDRLSARLADPNGRPVTMRTHHPDPNDKSDRDVALIAGRVTGASMDESGNLRWTGEIADTQAGRDIANLTTPEDPFLRNVSIRGWWVGESWIDSEGYECGADVEIDGLDFTDFPGVDEARITSAALAESADRKVITESMEDVHVTVTEAGALTPGSSYADPGYQSDKKKRYPLDTKAHIRSAWAYINKPANQKPYTSAQMKRIKGRIKAAAAKSGIQVTEESAAVALSALTEAFIGGLPEQITEAMANVSVSNGPADISASAYGSDPAALKQVVARLADAVLAALDAVDPDGDGDIDLPDDAQVAAGWSASETDAGTSGVTPTDESEIPMPDATSTEETTAGEFAGVTTGVPSPHGGTAAITETAPTTPAAAPAATPVTETARNFTDADIAALAEAMKAAEVTPVTEQAPETATPTTETVSPEAAAEMIRKGITEGVAAAKEELAEEVVALYRSGGRKGVVRPTDESGAAKPMHEMTTEERDAYASEAWSAVLGRPVA